MQTVKQLYERLRRLPWPALAGSIGNLALYEALLAGCADRVSRGELLEIADVPTADEETLEKIKELLGKPEPSANERALLEYFELLEEIRCALQPHL